MGGVADEGERGSGAGGEEAIEETIAAAPGTYVLVLRAATAISVRIGRLGTLAVRSGYYLYAGSACGPGGLRARIQHHARRAAHPHWHIDYLRRRTRLEAVWLGEAGREHEWAHAIGALRGATAAMRGFGSSDCRCETHLFRFARRPRPTLLLKAATGVAGGGRRS